MLNLRQQREEEFFQACLELAQAEWSSYLKQACRDSSLRYRIERLLEAHRRAENAPSNRRRSLPVEDVPVHIGPYRLTRLLGEGGMAVVHEAEQLEPVRRRVALKIVKLGMDTRRVIARFMTERQALAAMDHPYVAKVFDAGRTPAGRPFFVMEVVDGMPLLEYCDRNCLSIRARAELFISICQAVQHAHQKGIIHRDLKPSNVLVCSSESGPIPKIIDFGIAKAVGADIPERTTRFTHVNQVLGTPAYMSPEQAGLGLMDIDTRTDVYSLGVILYELLAGRLPADPAETGYIEFLSLLSQGELKAVPPSSQAGSSREGYTEAATKRATTPAGLKRQVEGDLDWIVMKALEADRSRRYDTAIALAEDLGLYLREEPLRARPPTVCYRARKFIRRHRAPVAATCVAAFALLAGTVAAGAGLMRATRAETAAREEAATARQVSDLLLRLFRLSNPNSGDARLTTVRDLLDRGTGIIETELRGQPKVQANLFGALSHVYEAMGLYRESKTLAEKSLALPHVDGREGELQKAAALLDLGRSHMRLGDPEQAAKAFEKALAVRMRVLGENHLGVARVLNNLGAVRTQLGRLDEAISAHRRALVIQERAAADGSEIYPSLRGLGMLQIHKRDFAGALESFQKAQAIVEKRYWDNSPFLADSLHNVALALEKLNRFEEAEPVLNRSLEIRKRVLPVDHPDLAFSYHSLGRVLEAQGKLKRALACFEEGVRIRKAALGPGHRRTANLVGSLGMLKVRLGDLDNGLRLLDQSFRTHVRALGPNDADTIESRKNLALALVKAQRHEEAIPHLRELMSGDVPPGVRIDLNDALFNGMRSLRAFREMEEEVARRAH